MAKKENYLEKKQRLEAAKRAREKRDALEEELREACRKDHEGVARRLVFKLKVDPECGRRDVLRGKAAKEKDSPFIIAAKFGSVKTALVLIEKGVEIKQTDYEKERTALHWACKRGHYKMAFFLLKKGVDPCKEDADGRTCLMHASWWGHSKIVSLLLTGRASSLVHGNKTENKRGWTALYGAAKYAHVNVVRTLVDHKLDCNITDLEGRSPLLVATDVEITSLLFQGGGKIELVDPKTGRHALHWASESGDVEMVKLILHHVKECRKDPQLLRNLLVDLDKLTGCSPQTLSKRNNHIEVTKLLRKSDFFVYQAVEFNHTRNVQQRGNAVSPK